MHTSTPGKMRTLTEVLKAIAAEGFSQEIIIKEGGLYLKDRRYEPEELVIIKFYRFEGESNPDDMSIIYSIMTCDGDKAVLIDAYGTYSNPEIDTLIKKIYLNQESKKNSNPVHEGNKIYALPHEIRNCLTGILTTLEILEETNASSTPEERKEYYNIMKTSAEKLEKTVNNQLSFENLELILSDENKLAQERKEATEHPADVINNVLEDKLKKYSDRGKDINAHADNNVGISISEASFKRLIEEVMENAFKHSKKDNRIIITDNIEKNDYVVEITNEGSGVSDEQVKENKSIYGFAIINKILEVYNGCMNVKTEKDGYTSIRLTLKTTNPQKISS
jgi:K+-sensing histidine kinase KdpD